MAGPYREPLLRRDKLREPVPATSTRHPYEYLSRIRDLVASSQHTEALAFADDHAGTVEPPLSIAQEVSVGDVLHVAAMAVGMDEYAARLASDETAEVA